MDTTKIPDTAHLVNTTLMLSFKNGCPLADGFIYDEIMPSSVIGALLSVCQFHGLPVKAWEVSISSYPLPQTGTSPSDLRYMSGLLLEADGVFFTVDFIQGEQHIGPVMYNSTDEYVSDKKGSFFDSYTGPIYALAQEVVRKPYADSLALEAFHEAIKPPLSKMRRESLTEIATRSSAKAAPSHKLKM